MLCNQCEQTPTGGCTGATGVCGKNEDIESLQQLLINSCKGIAAYAYQCDRLGQEDPAIGKFLNKALYSTLTNVNFDLNSFVDLNMEAGKVNFRAMELLDKGLTDLYGLPEVVSVPTDTVAGPGILITGHDFGTLSRLLEQTEGTGINIYTHSEMLPGHGYPKLKKHKHLVANYGASWVSQRKTFSEFPGPIIGTTNCVLAPTSAYKDRIYTTGIAGLQDVPHLADEDFSTVIAQAKSLPALEATSGGEVLNVGFHHTNVLAIADKILAAISAGDIKRIVLIGGCDTASKRMVPYRDLATGLPKDALILTLGCAKYSLLNHDYGTIGGIPRLIDLGQCNNAYSAVKIAAALAEALKTDVNSLPLTLVLSWFEQKALSILLSLLSLGIKGIHVGPTAPDFISPNVFAVLQDKFDLKIYSDADAVL